VGKLRGGWVAKLRGWVSMLGEGLMAKLKKMGCSGLESRHL
jgi:hypothetical protein